MKRVMMIAVIVGMIGSARAQQPPAAPAPVPAAEVSRLVDFNELLAKAQRAADNATPDELIKLLTEARALGQPHVVSGVIRSHLARRADPDPQLLRLAAQNALLTAEYRLASGRYRQFLKSAPLNADSAEAAGEYFQLLFEYVGQISEAFGANAEFGDRFHQAVRVRQYDGWFLDAAWGERATGAMAKRLVTIFSDKLPLEQERFAYGYQLDRLIESLMTITPANADAVLPGRMLVPLIREDAVRAAQLKFLVENLGFHLTRAGKSTQTLAGEFEPTLAAARAYVDSAPNEATLRQIMMAFSGGAQQDRPIQATLADRKSDFLVSYGFSKLPEAEQIKFLRGETWWMLETVSAEQWIALGVKHPQSFQKAAGTALIPWVTQTTNMAVYKAEATFLGGLAQDDAAVISAIAAGDSVNGSLQYLVTQSLWYGPFLDRSRKNLARMPDMVFNQIIPAWAAMKVPAAGTERNAFMSEAQLSFMEGTLLSSVATPFLLGPVRDSLRGAWAYCREDAARRDRFIGLIGKLAWVTFASETRYAVVESAMTDFREWSKDIRRQLDRLTGKTDEVSVKQRAALEAVVAQIVKIEAAFAEAIKEETDLAKAPSPQCREVAVLVKAIRAGDAAAYAAAAKALYPTIREYQKNKTPFGEALLEILMTPRDTKLDCFGQQADILADQLALRLGDPSQSRGAQVCVRMLGTREGWRMEWSRLYARREDTAMRDRLAEVLSKAIGNVTAKDQWDGELVNWYIGVVQPESEQAKAVFSAILDRDLFTKLNLRWGANSAVASELVLARSDFPALREKYPDEKFEDRMAAEIKRTGYIDETFWRFGPDRFKKVVNAAAEVLTADISYSFVSRPGVPAKYSRTQFFALSQRVLGAEGPFVAAYLAKIEAAFGKTRFDDLASGVYSISQQPANTPALRKAYFDRLREYVGRSATMPYAMDMPGLSQIAGMQAGGMSPFTDDELAVLCQCLSTTRPAAWGTDGNVALQVSEALVSRRRFEELISLVPKMWRLTALRSGQETMAAMTTFASKRMDANEASLVASYAAAGLEIGGGKLSDDLRNALMALRVRAMSKVGGGLMVPRSDRRYPILSAQALYHAGMLDSAWEQYLRAPDLARTELRFLDLGFTIWLIGQHTAMGQYPEAETLSKVLIQWVDTAVQGFDPEIRVQALIVAADISMARKDYPAARAKYNRVVVGREYNGTLGQARAQLRMAAVDCTTRSFDAATEILDKLDKHRDTSIQIETRYQRALLKFAQEDYTGARDAIQSVLAISPGNPQAVLLEGQVNLKMKKLVDATDVQIGIKSDQQFLIPGQALKVWLEDRTLSVVGKMTDIEIRAWTDGGDEEFFSLHQFGDSKIRFRGELVTALSPVRKGDRILQVLGRDKVHYSFSDRFRKVAKVPPGEPATLDVISDGELNTSSGQILTREEQEKVTLTEIVRKRQSQGAKADEPTGPLSDIRSGTEIKPGNPIYVMVIDPDRSVSHGIDTLMVKAATSSGDVVNNFPLAETETHSGVFTGKLTTAAATATAFSSDTEEGREANFVISTDATTPPWVALADQNRHKVFTVDMNDNVALGNMVLTADVPGRLLKRLAVQTSLNGIEYTTVATWPGQLPAWDGALRLRIVRYDLDPNLLFARSAKQDKKDPAGLKQQYNTLKGYFEYGFMIENNLVHVQSGRTAADLRQTIRINEPKIGLLRSEGPGSWALAHLQGTFYMSERQIRTFKVDTKMKDLKSSVRYLLAIDGQPDTERPKHLPSAVEVTVSLGKGYHTIDLFAAVQSQSQAEYELQWDTKEDPLPVRIPELALVKDGWPADVMPAGFKPDVLTANEEKTRFDVAFAPGSGARLVRLGIFDFESDAPAIRKLALTAIDGKTVLPTPGDVLALRKNQILELVPGDRVTLSYEDPSVVNRQRQMLEAFLNVTYHNGDIGTYTMESMIDPKDNTRKPVYIPIRCYKPDVPMAIYVTDPDADTSEKPDTVTVIARASDDRKVELKAIETDKNSGRFFARFFPVLGEAKRPSDLVVKEGDDFDVVYRDEHNTDPGIPWDRTKTVRYVFEGGKSELRVYDYASKPLRDGPVKTWNPKDGLPPVYELVAKRPDETHVDTNTWLTLYPGASLIAEVRNTSLAFPPTVSTEIYVQLLPTNQQAAALAGAPFDPSLPGTIRYRWGLSPRAEGGGGPVGYGRVSIEGDRYADLGLVLDEGRFNFTIPTALGSIDQMDLSTDMDLELEAAAQGGNAAMAAKASLADCSIGGIDETGREASVRRAFRRPGLRVRPTDIVRVALDTAPTNLITLDVVVTNTVVVNTVATNTVVTNNATFSVLVTNTTIYETVVTNTVLTNAPPEWEVRNIRFTSDFMMNVMDEKHEKLIEQAFIGDHLYLRLIDALADTTMEKDKVTLQVYTDDPKRVTPPMTLTETFENTGVFEGNVRLMHEDLTNLAAGVDTILLRYGSTVTFKYSTRDRGFIERKVSVHQGSDGSAFPFTKRFQDAEIAVQTQFTIAEAYFELAKKYRDHNENEVARRTIAQAKKLLDEAIRDYPKNSARIQADYLRANLAMESAEQTKAPQLKRQLYTEAVGAFNDLVQSHPESDYAPKSQFKKALVLELMGEFDAACDEYVKLAYTYPDHALVAETIARLGGYFMKKGRAIEAEAEAKADSEAIEREKIRIKAQVFYRVAAQVFIRLSIRFPDHVLAAKTKVLSAENWLRAGDPEKAASVYESLIEEKKAPPDLMAQAFYWCGECYLRIAKKKAAGSDDAGRKAFVMYKTVTWDYPDSTWAKFARGRLLTMQEPGS